MTPQNEALLRSFVEYLFRRKSPSLYIIGAGALLTAAAIGAGITFKISIPLGKGMVDLGLNTGEGTPLQLIWLVALIGLAVVVSGIFYEILRYRDERARLSRQLVFVIEARGLRDGPGKPLSEAVPSRLEGRREPYILDLRQNIEDGVVLVPRAVLPRILSLNETMSRLRADHNRRDVNVVYGGLAPVPFTFLTGIVLDDEDQLTVMDWERTVERWRELDGPDDGKRFEISGLEAATATDVVLAVSVSYPVNDSNLAATFAGLPVVRMTLVDGNQNAHWSAAKQAALADQFLQTVTRLEGMGTKRIHLVLAAPNSVVFRFGRIYDKRNLPQLRVYQFERERTPPYPWSVSMPVSGNTIAEIETTNAAVLR